MAAGRSLCYGADMSLAVVSIVMAVASMVLSVATLVMLRKNR